MLAMSRFLHFIRPVVLDVVVTPWEYIVDAAPALLLVGELVAISVTATVFLLRRFFDQRRK